MFQKTFGLVFSFLAGVAVTSVVAYAITEARASVRRANLLSDVHLPLATVLDDIESTIDDGDEELAIEKIKQLNTDWHLYLDGGAVPEQFAGNIVHMSSTSSGMNRESSAELGWPRDPQQLVDQLNGWHHHELVVYNEPHDYPLHITSGETNAWISTHLEELEKHGASARWNSDTDRYELAK